MTKLIKMKLNKFKVIASLSIMLCIIFSSCETGSLDKKYLKSADGKIYQLEWSVCDVYFVNFIKTSELDSLHKK